MAVGNLISLLFVEYSVQPWNEYWKQQLAQDEKGEEEQPPSRVRATLLSQEEEINA